MRSVFLQLLTKCNLVIKAHSKKRRVNTVSPLKYACCTQKPSERACIGIIRKNQSCRQNQKVKGKGGKKLLLSGNLYPARVFVGRKVSGNLVLNLVLTWFAIWFQYDSNCCLVAQSRRSE